MSQCQHCQHKNFVCGGQDPPGQISLTILRNFILYEPLAEPPGSRNSKSCSGLEMLPGARPSKLQHVNADVASLLNVIVFHAGFRALCTEIVQSHWQHTSLAKSGISCADPVWQTSQDWAKQTISQRECRKSCRASRTKQCTKHHVQKC